MRAGLFNISLFKKNRKEIEAKNYISLLLSGIGFVVLAVLEIFTYYLAAPESAPMFFLFYALLVAMLIVVLTSLYKTYKPVVQFVAVGYYLVAFAFVCNSAFVYSDEMVLVNFFILFLTLAIAVIIDPFKLIALQFIGASGLIICTYFVRGGSVNAVTVLRISIVALLVVVIGIMVIYFRMANLMFEKELLSGVTTDNAEIVRGVEGASWTGRDKYGLLSGKVISQRKIFTIVSNLTKRKVVFAGKENIFGIEVGMDWDAALDCFTKDALDSVTVNRIKAFYSAEEVLWAYKHGKIRTSIIAGFNTVDNYKFWCDCEWIVRPHPVSGELYCTLTVEDITEERILMGILNRTVERNYDLVMCVEPDFNRTVSFKVRPGEEISGEYGEPYGVHVENYVRERVLPHDKKKLKELLDMEHVRKELASDDSYEILIDELCPDSTLRKKLLRFSYLDPLKIFVCVVKQDVTEVIENENKAKKELDKALTEREAAINTQSEFMTRMSHEMRTPMNAILGLSSLMMDEINNPNAMRGYIAKVQYSGQFLLQLINDVLDITKMEQNKFQLNERAYSFGEFWESIDTMIGPMCLKKGVDFEWKSSIPENHQIKTDSLRITQIFINLLSNAVKYTPKGGHVIFECREKELDENHSRMTFIVKDDGIGMSEEFQKHLFEPFMQESKDVNADLNGTGLGLSIVKGIVDAMGGKITVKSIKGEGTTVRVVMDFEIVHKGPKVRAIDEEIDLSGKRVLIVEDNDINREIAVAILEKKNILTETAVNGQEAVDQFSSHAPGYYDLILMDIRMPVMSGITATKRIRAMERDDAASIPILAMTANAFSKDAAASLEAGLNEHLTKPIDPKALYQAIARYTM